MDINQWIFDRALNCARHKKGRRGRLLQRIARIALRSFAHIRNDPIVTYDLRGVKLAIPMTHALPRINLDYPDYSWNLARIARRALEKYPDLRMIDVGANVGDTAAMVGSIAPIPMLCIDGDDRYYNLLEQNARNWIHVEIEKAFIGIESSEIPAKLNSSNGSGFLQKNDRLTTQVLALEEILDLHPSFKASKILKVDTDGFDTLIIKGATDYLSRARPMVYFEYDPHFFLPNDPSGFKVFELLADLGYCSAVFFKNTGEFHAEARLDDQSGLHALHLECAGKQGRRYFDVCAFHACDADLYRQVVVSENIAA